MVLVNWYGQVGDGTTTARSTPVQVMGPGGNGFLTGIVAVAAGYAHSLAVRNDGTVWAWGANHSWSAQLGDGTSEDRHTPVQVSGLTGVFTAAAGSTHSGGQDGWDGLGVGKQLLWPVGRRDDHAP